MVKCEVIESCIACGYDRLVPVLDLGTQPLANSFKKAKDDKEDSFPLAIVRCDNCFHVQLTHKVNPDLLFKNYLYVSGTSLTQLEYFDWFADFVLENHPSKNLKNVLDIGCNDGSQLDAFKRKGIRTFGVDPAENLHKISSLNHDVVCGYFNELLYENSVKFDAIICQNAFAHNYNPLQFLRNVSSVMDSSSTLYITTSQANMILNGEFDTIYHEHLSFYNIKSMNELCKRAGLNLVDVVKHNIHGTSYVFIISKCVSRPYHIKNLISLEASLGLYEARTYDVYMNKCYNIIKGLKRKIDDIHGRGIDIIGFGAAAKGNTLLNASGVVLDAVIDENPMKQGTYTPGSSIPVYGLEFLDAYDNVDTVCFIPLAWNFYKEIKAKVNSKRPGKKDMFIKYFPVLDVESNQDIQYHRV